MPTHFINVKPKVLFIGGFSVPSDGTEGGQTFACTSLIASPLSEQVDFIQIDATQRSDPTPHILFRAPKAAKRLVDCLYHFCFSKIDTLFMFSGFSPSAISEKALLCILGKLFRKRVVLSIRFHPYLPGTPIDWIYRRYIRFALNCCDKIICQSQIAVDDLHTLFGIERERLVSVHNWLDTSQFFATPTTDGYPKQRIELVYVGRITPVKGIEYLIRAIPLILAHRQDFRLRIFGGGVLLDNLIQLSKDLDVTAHVEFMGWIKNEHVPGILRECDIFTFPTLHEGMPNSLLQAMACGLPPVTTNVSSIPAIVTDGETGIIVEPKSPQQLADGILKLMKDEDLRSKIGKAGAQQIKREHSIDSVWPRIAQILDDSNRPESI